MDEANVTSWTLVRDAAQGADAARERLARWIDPAVRAYLQARWSSKSGLAASVADAAQEVFVDLLRPGGALERADPERGSFRAFVYGVARKVALRVEERAQRERARGPSAGVTQVPSDEASCTRAFDRAWALALVRNAAARMRHRAEIDGGEEALRRVRLLEARFGEGKAIREIAAAWREDAAALHRLYRRAREDFRASLRIIVREQSCVPEEALEDECRQLAALVEL